MKPDCAVDDTHSSCKDKDSDGGKFVAAITNPDHPGASFSDPPDGPTVTSDGPFAVDNKCNSEGAVDMDDVDGVTPLTLNRLVLRVNKCKSNFHVSVKVWVGDGTNRFATRYLPGNAEFLSDGNTLHVHKANAWFYDTTGLSRPLLIFCERRLAV